MTVSLDGSHIHSDNYLRLSQDAEFETGVKCSMLLEGQQIRPTEMTVETSVISNKLPMKSLRSQSRK